MTADLIEHSTGSSGRPGARIRGTRVRVADIAMLYERLEKESAEERIRRALPDLEIAQIAAALSYYRAHYEEIVAEMKADHEVYEKFSSSR